MLSILEHKKKDKPRTILKPTPVREVKARGISLGTGPAGMCATKFCICHSFSSGNFKSPSHKKMSLQRHSSFFSLDLPWDISTPPRSPPRTKWTRSRVSAGGKHTELHTELSVRIVEQTSVWSVRWKKSITGNSNGVINCMFLVNHYSCHGVL